MTSSFCLCLFEHEVTSRAFGSMSVWTWCSKHQCSLFWVS